MPVMRVEHDIGNSNLLKSQFASDLFDGLCFRQVTNYLIQVFY